MNEKLENYIQSSLQSSWQQLRDALQATNELGRLSSAIFSAEQEFNAAIDAWTSGTRSLDEVDQARQKVRAAKRAYHNGNARVSRLIDRIGHGGRKTRRIQSS